jgi:hypothetical protein
MRQARPGPSCMCKLGALRLGGGVSVQVLVLRHLVGGLHLRHHHCGTAANYNVTGTGQVRFKCSNRRVEC